jgi:hypothetical protein
MKGRPSILVAGGLLVLMTALMATAIREESATIDEAEFLAVGYSYWHGFGFRFQPEHPPLTKLISSAPLLCSDVKVPPEAQRLLTRQAAQFQWLE